MSRRSTTILSLFALLVLTTIPAMAAGEAEAVNPPGWVGALILILAIVLALLGLVWARRGRLF